LSIRDALPQVLRREYPVLDPDMPVITALTLLRFHETDALPLSLGPGRKPRAVSGFSCLARLVRLGPKELGPFLKQPCASASEPLAAVGADEDLASLLNTFLSTRFGFARLTEKTNSMVLTGLFDLLGLYQNGTIGSTLKVEDVASPMFSMAKGATLREALGEMFTRRCRRVFISGTKDFIWDYAILEYLLSPSLLTMIAQNSAKDILDLPISEIGPTAASVVAPGTKLKAAAEVLRMERGRCLVLGEAVVTPWDVIIKPWKDGLLQIDKGMRRTNPDFHE
jgi:hypothetical protein